MPFLGIYSWSQYTIPPGIPAGDLTGDTQPNDPASPGYSPTSTTWIGQEFTFNGGAPTQIEINDDDSDFEDGYVETGTAQTLAQDVTIDGTLYPAGSVVENEFSLIDSSGQEIYVVRINGENVGFTYAIGEEPTATDTFTATSGLDGDPVDNADGTSSSSSPYEDVICFTAGTRITTPAGLKRAETLVQGDLITTADAGDQPLIWTGQSEIEFTDGSTRLKPVLIRKGCLGNGLPRRDLVVSPQHRMMLPATGLTAGFSGPEVFAPAKGLLPLKGVRIMKGKKSVTYVHLLLPHHAVIFAEGAPSESFYPGSTALAMMSDAQRREVLACFPALREYPQDGYGPMARESLTVQRAHEWARKARGTLALNTPFVRVARAA